jgi:hypothetical protein
MLKKGSIVLSIWCVINFILAFIILCYVIVLNEDSPILQVASFSEAEIASLRDCATITFDFPTVHSAAEVKAPTNILTAAKVYPLRSGEWGV